MPHVEFTPHLRRYFPGLAPLELEAADVAALVRAIDRVHPGLGGYIVEEDGALRRHVNIFVDELPVRDRAALSDKLRADSRVHVLQALSGG